MKRRTGTIRILCAAVTALLLLLSACAWQDPAVPLVPAPAETSWVSSGEGIVYPWQDPFSSETTAAAGQETAAPETTAAAPEPTTTAAPEPNTTAAPEPKTTAAPEPTTKAPEPTTKAPEPTTKAPEPTTKAPEPTTKAPEPTTKASEPTTTAPAGTELVLATLNIKHGAEGLDKIAAAIRDVSPDLIGLQEVDVYCERSGYVDEVTELARLAGYPYYAFAKAISLGSGEYGTALLSRFPIEYFEVTALDSGNGENRSLGHGVVFIEGVRLDVFVTHLSYEDRSVRIEQMKTISGLLKGCRRYAVLADLNSFTIEDISYLEAAYCVNRPERRHVTFRNYRNSSPDNIVVSRGFTELASGTSDAECSDHKLLYAWFRFVGE